VHLCGVCDTVFPVPKTKHKPTTKRQSATVGWGGAVQLSDEARNEVDCAPGETGDSRSRVVKAGGWTLAPGERVSAASIVKHACLTDAIK
jgi:hypothetical protein